MLIITAMYDHSPRGTKSSANKRNYLVLQTRKHEKTRRSLEHKPMTITVYIQRLQQTSLPTCYLPKQHCMLTVPSMRFKKFNLKLQFQWTRSNLKDTNQLPSSNQSEDNGLTNNTSVRPSFRVTFYSERQSLGPLLFTDASKHNHDTCQAVWMSWCLCCSLIKFTLGEKCMTTMHGWPV